MSVYLQLDKLTKSYGDRLIFSDLTLGVNEGDKIGIVAKNGTGKSTLLEIIAGKEDSDSGKIVWQNGLKIGYLPQKPELGNAITIESYIKNSSLSNHDKITEWDYEDKFSRLLDRFGIRDLKQEISDLSGGQKKRIALAEVIAGEPDMIILDEPTNHLDIDIIEWLENYLRRSKCTLLMVTHDRYFLDRVCNKIIEIANQTVYSYEGNYDYYLRRRQERIESQTAELAKIRNTLRREQEWMSRQPQARAGKAKYRINAFYDLKEKERTGIRPEKELDLDIKSSYIGSKIFEAENISKSFGDKVILRDFSYVFARYDKVGIIGANGVGKSTFIKMLQGLVAADSGKWNVGETVRFGYYSQEGISYDKNKKVIDVVEEDINKDGTSMSGMQYLTRFLFPVADQQKYLHTLSGGELCRLHLALVLMKQPNFLILDEPTNDLDIVTLGILEEYLADFKGCVIVVSHDRYFLDNISEHLFVMEGDGKIIDFPGTYSEYFQWKREKETVENAKSQENKSVRVKPKAVRERRMSFKEKKEYEALTEEIDSLTNEKKEIEENLSSGENMEDIGSLSNRYAEIIKVLDEKELRWLELSELE